MADVYRSGWLSQGPRAKEFEEAFAEYTGAEHARRGHQLHGRAPPHGDGGGSGRGRRGHRAVADVRRHRERDRLHGCDARVRRHRRPAPSRGSTRPRCAARITPRTKAIVSMAYGGHPGETPRSPRSRRSTGCCCSRTPRTRSARASAAATSARSGGPARTASSRTRTSRSARAAWWSADDPDVAARLRLLRSHGMTTLSWDRHRGHAAGYDVVALGHNFRIDEARCALGHQPPGPARRRERPPRAARPRYRDLAERRAGRRGRRSPRSRGATLAHHLFTVVLPEGGRSRRDAPGARRPGHPDEPALPAGAPLPDLRGAPRPTCRSRTPMPRARSRCRCTRT